MRALVRDEGGIYDLSFIICDLLFREWGVEIPNPKIANDKR